jgi:hypothetical protein
MSSTFSVFSISGHVGWMSGLPDSILKGGHQRTKQSLVSIQKSWVILLMNIHKPNRVTYDVSK